MNWGKQRSFTELLRQARAQSLAHSADLWHLRLEGLKGKKWDDGIERISTTSVSNGWCLSPPVEAYAGVRLEPTRPADSLQRLPGPRICQRYDTADRDVARPN